jgi:hypothetical protein
MLKVTVYSGPSTVDSRPGDVTLRTVSERDLANVLSDLGNEWRNADYMGQRQVVITIDPVQSDEEIEVRIRRDIIAEIERGL